MIGDGGVAIIGGPAAASGSAAQAVPEPGTAALLLAGFAGLLARRRRA